MLRFLHQRCAQPDCLVDGKPWITLRDAVAVKEGDSERFVLTFIVDRARADGETARQQAWSIAYDLAEAVPALADRLTVDVVPRSNDADADATGRRQSIEAFLRETLMAHEPTCEAHRRPGSLFLAQGAVTQETGWTPLEDHHLATFSTRASAPTLDDEICAARVVAAMLRACADAQRFLWNIRGARTPQLELIREVSSFVRERCAALCQADGRIWIALGRVYESDLVNLVFAVDRARLDEAQALDHARKIATELAQTMPSLTGRLLVDVEPASNGDDLQTDDSCRRIHAFLRDALEAHERDCELHRDRPGYLFIDEYGVTAETGYRPSRNHRRAKFSVDSSCPNDGDKVCAAQAIAALLRADATVDALLWECGPWK